MDENKYFDAAEETFSCSDSSDKKETNSGMRHMREDEGSYIPGHMAPDGDEIYSNSDQEKKDSVGSIRAELDNFDKETEDIPRAAVKEEKKRSDDYGDNFYSEKTKDETRLFDKQPEYRSAEKKRPPQKKKSYKWALIAVIVTLCVALVAVVAAIAISKSSSDDKKAETASDNTKASQTQTTEAPTEEETELTYTEEPTEPATEEYVPQTEATVEETEVQIITEAPTEPQTEEQTEIEEITQETSEIETEAETEFSEE